MERKTLILAILRAIRLLFLVIVVVLIACGAGGRAWYNGPLYDGTQVRDHLVGPTYPIDTWRQYMNFPGQFFPFVTCIIVFVITAVLFGMLFTKTNIHGQNKQLIFIINVVCLLLILVCTCVEAWYAAGGSVEYQHLADVRGQRLLARYTVFRVNAWIAAVGFLILTLIDLAVDAYFTRKD